MCILSIHFCGIKALNGISLKVINNSFRILKKAHAYLQIIFKTHVKFQNDWPKLQEELQGQGTYYDSGTTHHAPSPRKAENNVPPLYFEKVRDKIFFVI